MKGPLQVSSLTWVQSAASDHKIFTQKAGKSSWETLTVQEALVLLEQGPPPSVEDFVYILQKCRKDKILENGVRLHTYMRDHGLEAHQSLGNYLVPMLVDVGRINDAQEVFDRLAYRNEYSWNSLLTGYVKCGKSQHALSLYQKMQDDSLHPSGHTFVALLNACAKLRDEKNGRELHTEIVRKGLERDFLVGSTLVNMYAKCGLLVIAQEVFDELAFRDTITWTCLIAGYVKLGHGQQALTCFDQMQREGMSPNPLTFVSGLKACGCIGMVEKGQVMHSEIARRGFLERDVFIGNAVIDMYAKCGLVAKAQEVFDKLATRDVVSWNALITGYANLGNAEEAFTCFKQMQVEEVAPDAVTLVCNLKACSSAGDVDKGRQLHSEIAIRGFSEGAPLVDNALVDMYASCGLLEEAQEAFDGLQLQDAVAWTALIAGYTKHGFGEVALDCYQQMQVKGVTPDVVAYVCALKACSSIGAIHKGREIQAEIDRLQLLERYSDIGTALVDLYASCGLLAESQKVFDKLPARDVASWNALVLGYATHGYGDEVLKCFEQMQLEDVSPDANTLNCALKACGSKRNLDKGHEIHSEIVRKMLLEGHHDIGHALVDMYFSCGSIMEAQNVFDRLPVQDLASWNALISGYVNHGLYHESLGCLEKMKQGVVSPDSCTYACSLKACSSITAEDKCRELHAEIIGKGLLQNNIFSRVSPVQTTVLWNALITAYVDLERGEEALNCSVQMQEDGVSLDVVTYVCSLKACGTTGAFNRGQRIHADITKIGLWEDDLMVGTALVDMYAACCMLAESQKVFNNLVVRDVVAWNALISGHVKQGCDEIALEFFERMKGEGVLPNTVTHVCSLNACCNSEALKRGQLIHIHVCDEGLKRDMIGNALVSMYIKCGLLAKAQETFEKLSKRDVSLWNALIAGYSKYDLGEEALNFYEQMQREGITPDAVTFVCSLKACGSIGMIDKGQEMHTVIIKRGLLRQEYHMGNGLVDMYVKCGLLAEAHKVFDTLPARDTVSWNTLIAGNVNNDCGEGALKLVKQMQLECVSLDGVSFICSLKACGSMGATYNGLELHAEIIKKGLLEWNLVIGNALIDMYVGCGLLAEAQQVLKQLPSRDVVSWTTVIAGFLRHGHDEEALDCLEEMQEEGVRSDVLMWNALIAGYSHLGQAEKVCYILDRMKVVVKPDGDSFLSILAACSHTGLVEKGQKYFEVMNKEYGIIPTIEHFTCIVDLFGRAGQLDDAMWMIKKMPLQPDIVAWHTLLAACQKWGNVVLGIEAFESALKLDEKDAATFVGMFNIYAGAGKQEAEMMIDTIE